MAVRKVTATIQSANGIPKDNVVQTYIVDTAVGTPSAQSTTEINTAIERLYTVAAAAPAVTVASFLSRWAARTAGGVILRHYDIDAHLDGSAHGSPIATGSFTLPAQADQTALPSEVALVVSLRGLGWATAQVEVPDGVDPDAKPDRPRQRVSGKIYFGPFTKAAGDDAANGISRPHPNLRDVLLANLNRFHDELAADGHSWKQWSRTNGIVLSITEVQVDDAWDIQRRRGIAPSVRQTTTVGP